MAKRLTKEQREANEIEELRKQLSMIYAGAMSDEWEDDASAIDPSQLSNVLCAARSVFGMKDDDYRVGCHVLHNWESPIAAAKFLHCHKVRAWTKLPKDGGEA